MNTHQKERISQVLHELSSCNKIEELLAHIVSHLAEAVLGRKVLPYLLNKNNLRTIVESIIYPKKEIQLRVIKDLNKFVEDETKPITKEIRDLEGYLQDCCQSAKLTIESELDFYPATALMYLYHANEVEFDDYNFKMRNLHVVATIDKMLNKGLRFGFLYDEFVAILLFLIYPFGQETFTDIRAECFANYIYPKSAFKVRTCKLQILYNITSITRLRPFELLIIAIIVSSLLFHYKLARKYLQRQSGSRDQLVVLTYYLHIIACKEQEEVFYHVRTI